MNVSLNPHFDEFIQQQVKAGHYNSASEVIRDALRLLEQQQKLYQEKLEALRSDIQAASTSLHDGEGVPAEESFERLNTLIEKTEKTKP